MTGSTVTSNLYHNPKLSVAYSPCPNDTFIFCHMAKRPNVEVHLQDVETLNQMAFDHHYDVTKLSFHAWLLVQDSYQLLRVGSALGRACGPLVISKADAASTLSQKSAIAVPGKYTTANLLLSLWNPKIQHRVFMPFDRIMNSVMSGETDAGVIIHEGRFVFAERGFQCLVDLGDWWENETGHPIPLGCIAAKKSLGTGRIKEIEAQLTESIQTALNDPGSTHDYVKAHAQELEDDVIQRHIRTYVTDFTLDLGDEGQAAIDQLNRMAKARGILS
jgi:1,4-dihydroxy-6-naphthoate synthase